MLLFFSLLDSIAHVALADLVLTVYTRLALNA